VTLPLPRLIPLVVLAVAAAGTALIVTGSLSGRSGGDPAAKQAIEQGLGQNPNLKSGKFNATAAVKAEGAASAQLASPISVRVDGAFAESRKGRQGKLFMDASVDAAGQSIRFGVASTGGEAFVRFGGNYYAVPRSELDQLYGQPASAATNEEAIAALGFDPSAWIKDARDEGTANVGGAQTRHLSAEIDAEKMLSDFADVAARAQPAGTPQVSNDQVDELKNSIKDPKVDVYLGKADGILRRLTLQASIQAKDGGGEVTADVTFSDINKPQQISAPASARPFGQLESDLANGGLGALTGGGPAPGAGGGAAGPATGDPGAAASTLPSEAQAYLGCVRKAGGSAALQRCAALLP
jgi:hypothetical protein